MRPLKSSSRAPSMQECWSSSEGNEDDACLYYIHFTCCVDMLFREREREGERFVRPIVPSFSVARIRENYIKTLQTIRLYKIYVKISRCRRLRQVHHKVCLSLPLKKHSSSWLKLRWLETFGAFSKRAIHKELVQVTASQKNLMSQPTSGVPGFARSKKLISGSLG